MIATLIGMLLWLNPIALQGMVYVDLETGTYHLERIASLEHVVRMPLNDAKKKYQACSCVTKGNQHNIKSRDGDSPTSPKRDDLGGLVRCQAITLKGTQCKRTFQEGKYCWRHQRMNAKPGEAVDRCKAATKRGTQCSRKAKTNGYCWQHQ